MTDDTLYNATTASMTNLNQILQKINQGQGTVGKLVNDQEFYKNAKLTLQKVDKAADSLEDQGPLSVLGIVASNLGCNAVATGVEPFQLRVFGTTNRTGWKPALRCQAEVFQDLHGGVRFVQRVKMQPRRAGAQQFLALPRGVFDAEFNGGRVVIAQFIQLRAQRRRDFCAAKLGEFRDLRRAQNRE